jgi:murein DD-endopeptidase MepM/ murein hydrolase activator NlpD
VAQLLVVLLVTAPFVAAQPTRAAQPCQTVADCTNQINQDQQQQKAVANKIAALKSQIASLDVKEAQAVAIINSLKSLIAQTQVEVDAAQAAVNAAQAQVDQITTVLNATEARLALEEAVLASDKRQLAAELIVEYELQVQSTPLKELINGGSFNDFFTAVIDSRRISAQVKQTVDRVDQQKAQVEADVAAQTSERNQKVAALAVVAGRWAVVNAALGRLNSERADQQETLDYYAELQAQAQVKEQQAEAAAQALQTAISQLTQQRNRLGSGRLVWPDDGPISQGFGCTVYSFEPYDASCPWPHRSHNGLDIAGACGTNILAADTGIAYPQPFMSYGYGNWILVDHGAGMVTLYGHLEQYNVSYGQFVNRGQVIGYEGSTGNSTGCHLHFSVFIRNQAVNPLAYLPPR